MPSPDVTPYLDLRIYDKDPQDIFAAAIADLQTNLPQWIPLEGNTEVLLLEALALEVSESVFSINRLPSAIVQVLLKLFGITQDSGAAPIATLRFDMVGTTGYTIPAGVSARLALPGGLPPVIFTTTMELIIAPAASFGLVNATGDRFTDDANSVAGGTLLEFLDSVISVETVKLDSIADNGRDPETSDDYFARALERFGRLSDTLVLPSDFVSFALQDPTFYRAMAFDNWDGSGGAPGDDPGHITVAVYGNGAPNTSDEKTDLDTAMEAVAVANLSIHVIDPTITTQAVTATVKAKSGYVLADVQAAVVAALNNYLDPMTWSWSGTIRRFELISLMDQVPGVDYVVSVTTPASDVTLSAVANLVDAGTLTITVT